MGSGDQEVQYYDQIGARRIGGNASPCRLQPLNFNDFFNLFEIEVSDDDGGSFRQGGGDAELISPGTGMVLNMDTHGLINMGEVLLVIGGIRV
jgi:hypothetical protein